MLSRKIVVPALLLSLVSGLGVSAKTKPQQSSTAKSPTAKKKPASSSGTKASAPKTGNAKTGSSKTRGSGKRTSKTSRKRGQQAPTSDRINEIQTALAKDGSFSGSPNGKWDDSTVSAMKKFQSAHGLNPTGRLDAPTLQKLGLGSSTMGVAAPQVPPGAVSRLSTSKFNSAEPSPENQR